MSRTSAPVLTSLLLLLLLPPLLLLEASIARTGATRAEIRCSLRSCAALDVALLQDYVNSLDTRFEVLNDTDPNTDSTSIELQPFGALPSDWSRLLLLQNLQPKGTPLYDNLLRLSRLMLTAYFESEDQYNWATELSTDDYGLNTTTNIPITASYKEFEDQQANNVTLNSTAQKGSSWFNASHNIAIDEHNNEDLSTDENLSTIPYDSTTLSYYDDFLNFGTTNFNQSFFGFVFDNEANGNNSTEASVVNNNEVESTLATTEIDIDFFTPTTIPPTLNEIEEDENDSSSSNATDDSFTSSNSSDNGSGENSSINEAIHERSKENFLVSHLRIKNNKDKSENEEEVINSASFSVLASDESIDDDNSLKTAEDVNNHNKSEINSMVSSDQDSLSKESKTLHTQTIEDFFANENKTNLTGLSNFVNSTDTVWNEVDMRHLTSEESNSSGELLTKSIEDFFASEEESNDTTTSRANIESESEIELNLFESANETDRLMNLLRNTSENVVENFSKGVNQKEKEVTSKLSLFSEWNKELEQGEEKTNDVLTENLASTESIEINELLLSADPNISVSTQIPEDFYKPESTESNVNHQKSDSFDADKLISSVSVDKPLFKITSGGKLSSTTREKKNDDNPTTLADMISKSIFEAIAAATTMNSDEITEAVDLPGSIPNETEGGSAKYPNIPAPNPLPSPRNTMNHDKAEGQAHISASELDEGFENRTTNLTDDLFWKTATKQRPENDWGLMSSESIATPLSSEEVTNGSSKLRRVLMRVYHDWGNNSTPTTVTKLRKIEDSSWTSEDQKEGQEEDEDDVNTWVFGSEDDDKSFNLSAESSRNQQYKRSSGFTARAKMNKRKSRKRLDAEIEAERQYPTFLARESRQMQFAKKTVREDIKSQGVKNLH